LKHPTKRTYTISLLVLFLLGAIVYGLADRYLIEHVEGPAVPASSIVQAATEPEAPVRETAASTPTLAPAFDDWNYKSKDIEIHIDKVEKGTGSEKITYYVADVTLQHPGSLASALAKNTFGRNIVESTSKMASDHNAILAINGDYYGFRSDGVIIRNGTLYRNSPARTALAIYNNGAMKSLEEALIPAETMLADGVMHTFSFGPVLVQDEKVTGDFSDVKIDKNFGNRSIQSANPRTGVGMIAPNHYVFVVVDGRSPNYSRGMTLTEFAQVFRELGCTEAYNLDGGGSSTMYFMGRVVNTPSGKQEERSVSDILYIAER
jgi:exopolysaccharide biosynthesis protein